MDIVRVAAVSRDPEMRLELARAFDLAPRAWHVRLHTEAPDDVDVIVWGPDVEEADGIVFDPDASHRVIDEIHATLERDARSTLVAVAGTGGGVGTTSVALQLALNAARGHRSCYIGPPGSNVALRLDLPEGAGAWDGDGDVVSAATPVAGGFRVLLAQDGRDAIEAATSAFDRVIVETDPGDGDVLTRARAAVLVVPPTVPGARKGHAILQSLPDVRWVVVTNRVGPGGEMTKPALERILGRSVAVELPTCAPLRDAEDDGRLLERGVYRWPRAVARLWSALERA